MSLVQNILDFIWPQFCLACRQEGSLCCDSCLNDLKLLDINPLPWPEQSFNFQACYICLDYKQALVPKLIKNFKYNYLESISTILVDILAKQVSNLDISKDTILSNIPLHIKKKRQRGFDQTELLAKQLASKLNLEYHSLLKRTKNTKTQAHLNKVDRQRNLAQAFVVVDNNLKNRPLLLIDDITTTGTTFNEAAKVLKQAGFSQINCLAIAKNNPCQNN